MSEAVGYIFDRLFAFAHLRQDKTCDLHIGALVVAAYIVDFARNAAVESQIDCFAVVCDVQPVSDVQTNPPSYFFTID